MKGLRDLLGLKFFEKEAFLMTGSRVLIPSLVQVQVGHETFLYGDVEHEGSPDLWKKENMTRSTENAV